MVYRQKAQGIVEYALLLAFVIALAAVVIGEATATGISDNGIVTKIRIIAINVKNILLKIL